ncbi:MAG: hypothetical protein WKG07_29585 [Hymenobacter sp.]
MPTLAVGSTCWAWPWPLLYDTLRLRRTGAPGLKIHPPRPLQPAHRPLRNVAGAAPLALLEKVPEAVGFEIEITKGIMPGSGVGSSAASAAGAVVGANALLGNRFSNLELVDFAMAGEAVASGVRHADNIAPAIFGGFTLVRALAPVLDVVVLPAPPLWVAVVHPQIEVKTKEARRPCCPPPCRWSWPCASGPTWAAWWLASSPPITP